MDNNNNTAKQNNATVPTTTGTTNNNRQDFVLFDNNKKEQEAKNLQQPSKLKGIDEEQKNNNNNKKPKVSGGDIFTVLCDLPNEKKYTSVKVSSKLFKELDAVIKAYNNNLTKQQIINYLMAKASDILGVQ